MTISPPVVHTITNKDGFKLDFISCSSVLFMLQAIYVEGDEAQVRRIVLGREEVRLLYYAFGIELDKTQANKA